MLIKKDWNNIYKNPKGYKYYDLFSPHSDMEKVCEIFRQNHVNKVLDVGCGLGGNLLFLAQKGFEVAGLDSSVEAINKLQTRLKQNDLSFSLRVGEFQSLPFSDSSFDAVVCVQTLQHGYEQEVQKGVAEISRVLIRGGLFFLTVPGRFSHRRLRYSLVKTANRVGNRVYIPTQGNEIGVPHYIFNKKTLMRLLKNFTILSNWKDDKDYYCILAKKK